MGTCSSKASASRHAAGASLDRWKADDQSKDGGEIREDSVQLRSFDEDTVLGCIGFEPKNRDCFAGWEDGSIQRFRWESRDNKQAYKIHAKSVNDIIISPTSTRVYSCSRDTTIAITKDIDSETHSSVFLRQHSLNVSAIAVDANEQTLWSGGRDTKVVWWNLATAQVKASQTISQNVVTCAKWVTHEPSLVVQGSEDLTVKIWDDRQSHCPPSQVFRGYVYFPLSLDVSTDGMYVVTSSKGFNGVGGEVRVWDRRKNAQVIEFEGHRQDATGCCFLDGDKQSNQLIASVSKDGTVKVWDMQQSNAPCVFQNPHSGPSASYIGVCNASSNTFLAGVFQGQIDKFHIDRESWSLQVDA